MEWSRILSISFETMKLTWALPFHTSTDRLFNILKLMNKRVCITHVAVLLVRLCAAFGVEKKRLSMIFVSL